LAGSWWPVSVGHLVLAASYGFGEGRGIFTDPELVLDALCWPPPPSPGSLMLVGPGMAPCSFEVICSAKTYINLSPPRLTPVHLIRTRPLLRQTTRLTRRFNKDQQKENTETVAPFWNTHGD
jgi:hypothetical protein